MSCRRKTCYAFIQCQNEFLAVTIYDYFFQERKRSLPFSYLYSCFTGRNSWVSLTCNTVCDYMKLDRARRDRKRRGRCSDLWAISISGEGQHFKLKFSNIGFSIIAGVVDFTRLQVCGFFFSHPQFRSIANFSVLSYTLYWVVSLEMWYSWRLFSVTTLNLT